MEKYEEPKSENKHELEQLLDGSTTEDCMSLLRTFSIYARGDIIPDEKKQILYTKLFTLTDDFAKQRMRELGEPKKAEYTEQLKDLFELEWRLSEIGEDPVFDKENRANIKDWNNPPTFWEVNDYVVETIIKLEETIQITQERSVFKMDYYSKFFENAQPHECLGILRSFYKDFKQDLIPEQHKEPVGLRLFELCNKYLLFLEEQIAQETKQEYAEDLIEFSNLVSKISSEYDSLTCDGMIFHSSAIMTEKYPDITNDQVEKVINERKEKYYYQRP